MLWILHLLTAFLEQRPTTFCVAWMRSVPTYKTCSIPLWSIRTQCQHVRHPRISRQSCIPIKSRRCISCGTASRICQALKKTTVWIRFGKLSSATAASRSSMSSLEKRFSTSPSPVVAASWPMRWVWARHSVCYLSFPTRLASTTRDSSQQRNRRRFQQAPKASSL
jgi:hypothetical protein